MQLIFPAEFNEVFGIKTNFAAVTPLDDHGDPVGGGSAQPNNGTSLATSSASPNFGTCSTPQIKFGVGFDGRKETAFEPVDQGSRPNPCAMTCLLTLVNHCQGRITMVLQTTSVSSLSLCVMH